MICVVSNSVSNPALLIRFTIDLEADDALTTHDDPDFGHVGTFSKYAGS
jgi:hypothetical protein